MEKNVKRISWEAAEAMMNAFAFAYVNGENGIGYDPDDPEDMGELTTEVNDYAREMFVAFCEMEGITEIEEPPSGI